MAPSEKKESWVDALPVDARSALLAASDLRSFSDDQVIYTRGRKLWGAYTVERGRLEARRSAYKGDKFVLKIVYPGESLGLAGLFGKNGAVNTIVARGDVTLRYFPKDALVRIGAQHPVIFERIIEYIEEALSLALSWIDFSVSASAAEKVLWNLIHLSQFSPTDERGLISISISQEGFARMLGISRQVANAELNRLVKLDVVSMSYGTIRVNGSKLNELKDRLSD